MEPGDRTGYEGVGLTETQRTEQGGGAKLAVRGPTPGVSGKNGPQTDSDHVCVGLPYFPEG